MKKKALEAHVTCFWHGKMGARKPPIPQIVTEILNLLPADIQTDFDADHLKHRAA
jgi:hypothetical protein